jgi:hypothetical protein
MRRFGTDMRGGTYELNNHTNKRHTNSNLLMHKIARNVSI